MFHSPLARTGLVLLTLVTAYVFWAGGRPERWAAALNAAAWLLVALLQDPDPHRFPLADFLVDTTATAGFITLAVVSRRTWAAFLAASSVLGVANYLAKAIDADLHARAFITTSYLWALSGLISLSVGGWSARRREISRQTL